MSWPAVVDTWKRGALAARIDEALRMLERCTVCPRDCEVNRLEDEKKACRVGRRAVVSSAFAHFGEEDCLRGWNGSGTIFFSWCNLKCVFCFHPETQIATNHGLEAIHELFDRCDRRVRRGNGWVGSPREGLQVVTRSGQLAPVSKVFKHTYEGELIRLKVLGAPPILLTPEHRVFMASSPTSNVEKRPASDLSRGDYLVVPKRRCGDALIEVDVAAHLATVMVGRERAARSRRVQPVELAAALTSGRSSFAVGQALGYHPTYVRKLRAHLRSGTLVLPSHHQMELHVEGGKVRFDGEHGEGVAVRKSLTAELAWLLGFYCAEGHVSAVSRRPNASRVVFSSGRHETALVERARQLLKEVFEVDASVVKRRTTLSVECYRTSVAKLFESMCGTGAGQKQVPVEVTRSPRQVIRSFLDGYLAGDGHVTQSHRVATTISRSLALGLFQLGLHLDVLPTFFEHTPPPVTEIEGRTVRQSTLYMVKFGRDRLDGIQKRSRPMWRDLGDRFLVPVRSLERAPYSGDVYNLEVDDSDHSYLAPFLAVANCQNWEISNEGAGEEVDARQLAGMMLDLQRQGCHNINFVTPEHVVPQVLEALPYALEGGLRLPIVYNTSAYDSLHSIALLDGVVDIYMPDFKLWDEGTSSRLLKARDYPEVARAAVRAMHRQVGDLEVDGDGLARRGLLVRHLVMPEAAEDTARIMEWLARECGPRTYVNVMDQYHPDGMVARHPARYPAIARPLRRGEHERALEAARAAGLTRIDERNPHPKLRRKMSLRVLF